MTILNRRANAEIKAKVNGIVNEIIKEKAKGMNHNDFVKASIAGVFQVKIKKTASKIYPVRFSEITKIETNKAA
jgi:ribosomal protein S3AE